MIVTILTIGAAYLAGTVAFASVWILMGRYLRKINRTSHRQEGVIRDQDHSDRRPDRRARATTGA